MVGNLDVRRDWGWAAEYVDAMYRIMRSDSPEDFVIATGQSFTLKEFTAAAFAEFGLDWRDHVVSVADLKRPSDIMVSVARPDRVRERLGGTDVDAGCCARTGLGRARCPREALAPDRHVSSCEPPNMVRTRGSPSRSSM